MRRAHRPAAHETRRKKKKKKAKERKDLERRRRPTPTIRRPLVPWAGSGDGAQLGQRGRGRASKTLACCYCSYVQVKRAKGKSVALYMLLHAYVRTGPDGGLLGRSPSLLPCPVPWLASLGCPVSKGNAMRKLCATTFSLTRSLARCPPTTAHLVVGGRRRRRRRRRWQERSASCERKRAERYRPPN
ncbi:hypothetical protein IWZ03DRAFT_381600, partial [Phyllosticta citriasiana]